MKNRVKILKFVVYFLFPSNVSGINKLSVGIRGRVGCGDQG